MLANGVANQNMNLISKTQFCYQNILKNLISGSVSLS